MWSFWHDGALFPDLQKFIYRHPVNISLFQPNKPALHDEGFLFLFVVVQRRSATRNDMQGLGAVFRLIDKHVFVTPRLVNPHFGSPGLALAAAAVSSKSCPAAAFALACHNPS